jgi:hypothetical protein
MERLYVTAHFLIPKVSTTSIATSIGCGRSDVWLLKAMALFRRNGEGTT